MTIDITKPLDTELARTLPGYIRETRAALEGAVTDSSAALAAVGILENEVADLADLIAAALVKFPNQGVFGNGDATPSVSGGIIYRTANTTSTAITYLDGGFAGQMVIIVADDENTTVVHNPGYIILEGGVSITFNANQGIILVCHENSIGNKQWIQVGSIGGGSSTGNAKFNRDTFTVGAGGQSSFDTSVAFQTGQKLMFPYVNGELQPSSKFTEVDSNTITFGETLPEGTFVELVYITTLSVTTSVDDLFVVNKPYLDVRQYNSFAEAITYAVNQNKVLLISRPVSISANMTIEANLLCITGGELQIASGYNTVFDGSVTLEAGSKISTTAGDLTFNSALQINGGVVENLDAGHITSIYGPFRCGLYQCFDGAGTVTFGGSSIVTGYFEWWGASGGATPAINAVAMQKALDCRIPISISKTDFQYDTPLRMSYTTVLKGLDKWASMLTYTGLGHGLISYSGGRSFRHELSNFYVKASNAANAGVGIYFDEVLTYGRIENVIVQNFGLGGIHLLQGWVNVLSGCEIQNNDKKKDAQSIGIRIGGVANMTTTTRVVDCYVSNMANTAGDAIGIYFDKAYGCYDTFNTTESLNIARKVAYCRKHNLTSPYGEANTTNMVWHESVGWVLSESDPNEVATWDGSIWPTGYRVITYTPQTARNTYIDTDKAVQGSTKVIGSIEITRGLDRGYDERIDGNHVYDPDYRPVLGYVTGATVRLFTLPAASSCKGQTVTLVKNNSTGILSIIPFAGDNISGKTDFYRLYNIGEHIELISDGVSSWKVIRSGGIKQAAIADVVGETSLNAVKAALRAYGIIAQ